MKKLILTFGIFLAGIFYVNAQNKATDKMVNRLTQVCQLSPDQANRLQPIVATYIKNRRANKQQYANDPDGLKAANKQNNEDYTAQLKTVLTPDQLEKLKEYNARQRAKRQGQQGEEQEGGGQGQ